MKKNWICFSLFCCITALVLVCLNCFVFVEVKAVNAYSSFYKQQDNSLDVVSIGNSTVQYGINPCEAWKEYGITSHNICSTPTHPEVIIIAIDEIARLQNPKVVYIDINGLTYQRESEQENFVKNYINAMPDGKEKDALCKAYPYAKVVEDENWENEIFDQHNNFRQLSYWRAADRKQNEKLKGFVPIYRVEKQKPFTADAEKVTKLPADGQEYLIRILECCRKYPDINFIFGKMPRFLNEKTAAETYSLRAAIPTINEYGYTYVEWEDYIDEIGLDPNNDVYDEHHLNVWGSIKFTKFFVNYLDQKFNITGGEHSAEITKDFNSSYAYYQNKVKNTKKFKKHSSE